MVSTSAQVSRMVLTIFTSYKRERVFQKLYNKETL